MSSGVRARKIGSVVLLAGLAAGLLASRALPARPPAAPASPKPAPRAQSMQPLPASRPLPDSVLALVDKTRIVSAASFRKAWVQLGPASRPDSLTPDGAREFLDLLIDKEVLAVRAIQETWVWTSLESAQVISLRDRTIMRVALDQTLAEVGRARAARGDSALSPEALGVAARESTVARLEVTYDEVLIGRLATAWGALPRPSADSSLWARLRVMGQMPTIDPADTGRVVARSSAGTVRVADLLEAWKKLNPLFRPRVETPNQVRDLVKNALFERILRRQAQERGLERHPGVIQAVDRQREFLASQYFVSRDVYDHVATDDATLRRRYDRDPDQWSLPARIRLVRLVLPGRSDAATMALRLRDPAEADSLVARGLRSGVDYATEIASSSDSVLFARSLASGTGTVLGPDSVAGGWQVARVSAVLPGQGRSFDEVKDLVRRVWIDEDSERRMRELLATLRKRVPVVVNEPGIAALVRTGVAPRSSGRAP